MGKSSCCNMIRKTRDEDTGFHQQLKCLYKFALLIIVDFDSVSLSPEMFRFHRGDLRSAAAARGDNSPKWPHFNKEYGNKAVTPAHTRSI